MAGLFFVLVAGKAANSKSIEKCLSGVYRVNIQTTGATHDFGVGIVLPFLAFEAGGLKVSHGLTRVKNYKFQLEEPRARGRRKIVIRGKAIYGPIPPNLPQITGPVKVTVKIRGRKAKLKGNVNGTAIDFMNGRVHVMQGTITSRSRRVRC